MELAIIKKMIELQVAPSKLGMTENQFVSEDAKRAFAFVTKFYGDHGKLPAIPTVDGECNTHTFGLQTHRSRFSTTSIRASSYAGSRASAISSSTPSMLSKRTKTRRR